MKRYAPWIGYAVLLLGAPLIFSDGSAVLKLSQMAVMIMFALSYNILLGQTGLLSFGHAVFFGLAGYSTVHLVNLARSIGIMEEFSGLFLIGLIPVFGALVGCFFGILIGYVSTRRAGTIFAMISLGIGEMVTAMTLIFVNFFNGEDGLQTDRYLDSSPLGITFGQQIEVYYLIAVWALVCTLLMYLYTRTPMGRMSNAVRDNSERVQFVGFNMQRIRWVSFTLAATFAGAAGALHAISYEQIGFETVSTIQSGAVLFMAYIGGVGVFFGPIIGAVVITLLQTMLIEITKTWPFYFGLIFILVILFAPGGIAGILMLHQQIWQAGFAHLQRLAVPYAIALLSTAVFATGCIGLIEMLAHTTDEFEFEPGMQLFWMAIDTASFVPWIAFAAITAVGFALCRKVYPRTSAAYHSSLEAAQREARAATAPATETAR